MALNKEAGTGNANRLDNSINRDDEPKHHLYGYL